MERILKKNSLSNLGNDMKKIIALLLTISTLGFSTKIPEPYASIVDLPFDGHGWFGNDQPLAAIIHAYHPKIVIEIGSWLGSSTRFIASHMPDDGRLYAIDTWCGSQNEELHLKDPRLPYLYQLFLSNVKHAQLTNKIIPVRMESIEASRALNVKADLIYIDAAHDSSSVINDIFAWYPHLNDNGIMCGDDWGWESVRAATIHCASVLNKRVYGIGGTLVVRVDSLLLEVHATYRQLIYRLKMLQLGEIFYL